MRRALLIFHYDESNYTQLWFLNLHVNLCLRIYCKYNHYISIKGKKREEVEAHKQ
jgi:hypothetical protein